MDHPRASLLPCGLRAGGAAPRRAPPRRPLGVPLFSGLPTLSLSLDGLKIIDEPVLVCFSVGARDPLILLMWDTETQRVGHPVRSHPPPAPSPGEARLGGAG